MTDQLVSFETAKLAKKKGFKEPVRFYYYDNDENPFIENITDKNSWITYPKSDTDLNSGHEFIYSSPTQSLLQKWLREKHKLEIYAYSNASGFHYGICKSFHPSWFSGGTHIKDSDLSGPNGAGGWNTYEEALEQGLITALNII